MDKFKVLVTTALFTLGLLLATPAAMADPELKNNGSDAVVVCITFQTSFVPGTTITWFELFGFENFGQCVSFFKPGQ